MVEENLCFFHFVRFLFSASFFLLSVLFSLFLSFPLYSSPFFLFFVSFSVLPFPRFSAFLFLLSGLLFLFFPSFPFCSFPSFSFSSLFFFSLSCVFYVLLFTYKKLLYYCKKDDPAIVWIKAKEFFYKYVYDSTHNIDPQKIVSSSQRSISEGAFYGGRSASENDTDGKEKELLRRSPVRTIFVCCRRYRSNIP